MKTEFGEGYFRLLITLSSAATIVSGWFCWPLSNEFPGGGWNGLIAISLVITPLLSFVAMFLLMCKLEKPITKFWFRKNIKQKNLNEFIREVKWKRNQQA